MNKIIFIFSFTFITNIIYAGDSLKKKPLNIIEFNFSGLNMINERYSDIRFFDLYEKYETQLSNFITLNFQRCITKKYKGVSQLYVGIGINYSSGILKHTLTNHSNSSGHFPDVTSYSQYEFNYNFKMISITPQLNYNLVVDRVIIFNKLGISYSKYFSSNSYNYNEIISNSHPDKNPIYITPQNPDGWYWTDIIVSNTAKTEVFPVKSGFNIFYNISAGFRIWKLMPTIGVDLNYSINKMGITITKSNVGLAYLF